MGHFDGPKYVEVHQRSPALGSKLGSNHGNRALSFRLNPFNGAGQWGLHCRSISMASMATPMQPLPPPVTARSPDWLVSLRLCLFALHPAIEPIGDTCEQVALVVALLENVRLAGINDHLRRHAKAPKRMVELLALA